MGSPALRASSHLLAPLMMPHMGHNRRTSDNRQLLRGNWSMLLLNRQLLLVAVGPLLSGAPFFFHQ